MTEILINICILSFQSELATGLAVDRIILILSAYRLAQVMRDTAHVCLLEWNGIQTLALQMRAEIMS